MSDEDAKGRFMKISDVQCEDLARVLLKTRPQEMTCDEWVDHVAGYAELRLAGRDIPADYDDVVHHIDLCPECAEEFEAILFALSDSN